MVYKRKNKGKPTESDEPSPREVPSWGRATCIAPNAFTRFMDAHNLKASAVARMLGCSRAAVYDLRRRLYLPKLELAQRIAALAEQAGGPSVPESSWSKEPTPEDIAHAEAAMEMAMSSRSTRRMGKHISPRRGLQPRCRRRA
jgi:DNA-binding XRE family transcriptional regulator